jgi:hypothetical protein
MKGNSIQQRASNARHQSVPRRGGTGGRRGPPLHGQQRKGTRREQVAGDRLQVIDGQRWGFARSTGAVRLRAPRWRLGHCAAHVPSPFTYTYPFPSPSSRFGLRVSGLRVQYAVATPLRRDYPGAERRGYSGRRSVSVG